jgi:hypothetical protein
MRADAPPAPASYKTSPSSRLGRVPLTPQLRIIRRRVVSNLAQRAMRVGHGMYEVLNSLVGPADWHSPLVPDGSQIVFRFREILGDFRRVILEGDGQEGD